LTVKQWMAHPVLPADSATSRSGGDYQLQLAAGGPGCRALATAERLAAASTTTSVGRLFGVEFFLCGPRGQEEWCFSEPLRRGPRQPAGHLRGQKPQRFDLHLRCWGCRSPPSTPAGAGRSRVILATGQPRQRAYEGVAAALPSLTTQGAACSANREAGPSDGWAVGGGRGGRSAEARGRADRAASRSTWSPEAQQSWPDRGLCFKLRPNRTLHGQALNRGRRSKPPAPWSHLDREAGSQPPPHPSCRLAAREARPLPSRPC